MLEGVKEGGQREMEREREKVTEVENDANSIGYKRRPVRNKKQCDQTKQT
jgi:hypothetical protein